MTRVSVWLTLLALAVPARGEPVTALQVLRRLQKFYDSARDFKAAFYQEYTSRVMGRPRRSQGFVYVKKPGKMRWDYRSPQPKHFVLNGHTLYIYDPELEQVVVDRAFLGSQLTTAVTFLWGRGRLEKSFAVRFADDQPRLQRPGAWVLELRPRGRAQFKRLWLVVDKRRATVLETMVEDPGGNLNRIRFSKVAVNVGLKDAAFSFTIPEGVEVVEVPAPRSPPSGKP